MQFGSYLPPPYPFPDRWWVVANSPQSAQWLQPTIPFQQSYLYPYYQPQQQQTVQANQGKKEATENPEEVANTTDISNEESEFVPTDKVVLICPN